MTTQPPSIASTLRSASKARAKLIPTQSATNSLKSRNCGWLQRTAWTQSKRRDRPVLENSERMGKHRLMRALAAPMSKAAEFRNFARDCRDEAETAKNGNSKEQWLKLADYWERIARHAERFPDLFS